jgi:hypothetical protein
MKSYFYSAAFVDFFLRGDLLVLDQYYFAAYLLKLQADDPPIKMWISRDVIRTCGLMTHKILILIGQFSSY